MPKISFADERLVRLAVPQALIDSGLPKFMLPRFTLKTQVRVQLVLPGEAAEAEIGARGRPVFTGLERQWHLRVNAPEHAGTKRFADWLTSEIGQRAVTGFRVDGVQIFDLPQVAQVEIAQTVFDGDAALGALRARQMCARCHVVDPAARMKSIDSTPSFFALRSLSDWDERFQVFYVLNPHPAFTQVAGLTPPFDESRPPPIVPVEMTVEDVEAILAYVAALSPADLGAPLQHQ